MLGPMRIVDTWQRRDESGVTIRVLIKHGNGLYSVVEEVKDSAGGYRVQSKQMRKAAVVIEWPEFERYFAQGTPNK